MALVPHASTYAQAKTMTAIERCRTAAAGCHIDTCENCGNVEISSNSCRDRHYPKGQTLSKERRIDNQKFNLLNIGYFHVVFTVPDDLRPLFYQNPTTLYGLLFKTVDGILHQLSTDKKYLGAKPGFTSILHSWGQSLWADGGVPERSSSYRSRFCPACFGAGSRII